MKIALYYPWIYLKSGVERTILETVKRSRHEFTIFTNHYDREGTYPEFKNLNVIELKKISVKRDIASVLRASLTILFQRIDLDRFDSLLVHSEGLGDLILLRNNKIPAICFCYTPLRPVFDSDYKTYATNKRSVVGKVFYHIFKIIFQIVDMYLWTKYNYTIFISSESLKRAKAGHLLNKRAKYKIIHPGISWEDIKPTWNYNNYFFLPGRIMWTKNIELAIEAFKLFSKRDPKDKKFKLVIAGQVDKKSKKYFAKLIHLSKNNKNITFIKNPSDKKMAHLYANCFAVLATSFNEDWGLTPIEANAYGKPVLAVNRGGFKESQINNQTGFLLRNDPEEFASKMKILVKNYNTTRSMGKRARLHSQKYSWSKFVKSLDFFVNYFSTHKIS